MASTETQAAELTEAQLRFVDDFGQYFARFGLTLTFGRVFGVLLMSDDALGLDDIACLLGVSKSGVSVAARELERLGLARRIGTPGTRRVLYGAVATYESLFEAQFARIRQQLLVLRRADALLTPGTAKRRMSDLMDLHEFWLEESRGILDRWRHREDGR